MQSKSLPRACPCSCGGRHTHGHFRDLQSLGKLWAQNNVAGVIFVLHNRGKAMGTEGMSWKSLFARLLQKRGNTGSESCANRPRVSRRYHCLLVSRMLPITRAYKTGQIALLSDATKQIQERVKTVLYAQQESS